MMLYLSNAPLNESVCLFAYNGWSEILMAKFIVLRNMSDAKI